MSYTTSAPDLARFIKEAEHLVSQLADCPDLMSEHRDAVRLLRGLRNEMSARAAATPVAREIAIGPDEIHPGYVQLVEDGYRA